MKFESPLYDRIRVKPAEDRRLRAELPCCDWPNCSEGASHRAPKGRNREREYWRFCLSHVREYNQSYDFFAGMSDDAVARYQKDALTGHLPTWRMGAIAALSFGFLFLASASKLKPLAPIFGLIVGYALDVLGQTPVGEAATRALLYTWLFVAMPALVSIVYNVVLGRHPRRLATSELARRLRRLGIGPDGHVGLCLDRSPDAQEDAA